MMDMKLVKNIKAVSPLIATIILIAITVAGGLVTYALFTSTAGVSSAKGQVSFESVDLVRTGEQLAFAATLKNGGNKPVKNITVSLHQNEALSFDGVDDYVDCGHGSSLNILSEVTYAAWFKSTSTADTRIAEKYQDETVRAVLFGFVGGKILCEIKTINGLVGVWSIHTFNDGLWHHGAITYSQAVGKIRVYIDGNLENEGVQSGTIVDAAAVPLIIGSRKGTSQFFNGLIDEVRIYNRALTADEIQESYQGYSNNAGMVLYLPFDGDTKDYSGLGNDGTNYGATFIDAPDVYVVTGGLEPGRTVAISNAIRVSGPHGKYVVGNRYSITVSAVYVDGSESAATTTVTCR